MALTTVIVAAFVGASFANSAVQDGSRADIGARSHVGLPRDATISDDIRVLLNPYLRQPEYVRLMFPVMTPPEGASSEETSQEAVCRVLSAQSEADSSEYSRLLRLVIDQLLGVLENRKRASTTVEQVLIPPPGGQHYSLLCIDSSSRIAADRIWTDLTVRLFLLEHKGTGNSIVKVESIRLAYEDTATGVSRRMRGTTEKPLIDRAFKESVVDAIDSRIARSLCLNPRLDSAVAGKPLSVVEGSNSR